MVFGRFRPGSWGIIYILYFVLSPNKRSWAGGGGDVRNRSEPFGTVFYQAKSLTVLVCASPSAGRGWAAGLKLGPATLFRSLTPMCSELVWLGSLE